MSTLKVYEYERCTTCKKALKYLDDKKVLYKKFPIREKPPTKSEFKKMLKNYNGGIKRLFNTSSLDYREMKIKDKLGQMSEEEIIDLLSTHGNLVKRPFVISSDIKLVGFKEEEWLDQGL